VRTGLDRIGRADMIPGMIRVRYAPAVERAFAAVIRWRWAVVASTPCWRRRPRARAPDPIDTAIERMIRPRSPTWPPRPSSSASSPSGPSAAAGRVANPFLARPWPAARALEQAIGRIPGVSPIPR